MNGYWIQSKNLCIDLDEKGNLVSMTIEHAKEKAGISEVSFLQMEKTSESLSSGLTGKEAIKLASQAEKYFAANDFEKALQSLKQLQQLVSRK